MRSVILVLIGLALGCFIRPAHSAWAQAPAFSGTVIAVAGSGSFGEFSGDAGLAADAGLNLLGLANGIEGASYFAGGGEISFSCTNGKA